MRNSPPIFCDALLQADPSVDLERADRIMLALQREAEAQRCVPALVGIQTSVTHRDWAARQIIDAMTSLDHGADDVLLMRALVRSFKSPPLKRAGGRKGWI